MIKNNVASVFVYVLILVTLTASMAMIVVSNISVLQNTLDEEELDLNLESSFREQFFSTIDRTVYFNTDG
jgi:citrate lyase gamma subunit